jgi:hypothetical protein
MNTEPWPAVGLSGERMVNVLVVPVIDALGSWLAVTSGHPAEPNTIRVHHSTTKISAAPAGPRCRLRYLNASTAMSSAKMTSPH